MNTMGAFNKFFTATFILIPLFVFSQKEYFPTNSGVKVVNEPYKAIVNATIVAIYGSIESNCEGIGQPLACPTSCAIVIPPNIKAPTIMRQGIQEAKTTKASAIHPLPAVIPSDQCGVNTKGI